MKDGFSLNTVVLEFLVFQAILVIVNVESYTLKCPSQNSWKIRDKLMCNITLKYFCLYNNVVGTYVEGCNRPDWDRKGSKRIFANSFTRGKCIHNRFQPFNFQTESMSDCIYDKSHCNEEGQVIYKAGSSKDDRTCRCDYTKSYAFLKNPKHVCFCIPTKEDCSCYVKSCPVNSSLSPDYSCNKSGDKQNQTCTEITKFDKTLVGNEGENQISLGITTSNFKWRYTTHTTILALFSIVTILGFFIAVLHHEWTSEKIQLLARYFRGTHKAGEERLNEGKNQSIRHSDRTKEEVNFLRLIHLLVRVVCPVVRMFFDEEIQPDQLRKTLDENKQEMLNQYRKKDKIINDFQWSLLFGPDKGQTVTSKDFDIRLMTYLLSTLANIDVGDLYPVYSDITIRAMLSRIQFRSKETLRNFDGKLSEYTFNENWDCIGQAVLKLASSLNLDTKNDPEKTRLIVDRLLTLNPKNIDTRSLGIFIDMSESRPGIILQQVISEYCASKSTTVEEILRNEKHQLYHKRIKNVPCCICPSGSIYHRFIPEQQWKSLYSKLKSGYSHSCQSGEKPCIERFVPKRMTTWDLLVSKALILNIPDILTYVINRLNICEFDQFLLKHQHVIYHSMDGEMCCKCDKIPTEKIVINKEEWDMLFKKEDNISCNHRTKNCCCQYSVRNRIKSTDLEDICLSKIFSIAGPIGLLNKIEQDALLYFLYWTVDSEPLQNALLDLENMKEDKTCNINMSSVIPNQLEETTPKQFNVRTWIDIHMLKQEATRKQQLQLLMRDEDGLFVRSVLVPDDFSLPCRTKKFNDLTTEETNYLVVVYGLTKLVYPVIKDKFNTQCPDHFLNEIRFGIQDKQMTAKESRDVIKSTENIKVQILKKQLFPSEELKNPDFELMINILKERSKSERNKCSINHLDATEMIRREIVQSSSGTLDQTKFNDIISRMSKAVLHLGGEKYKDELSRLRHTRNIFE